MSAVHQASPAHAVRAATHERHHRSVLARLEKQALVAIAARLPLSITSDHLSAFGLACMALAGAGFALFRLTPLAGLLVVAALAGNWFGDSLDGTVARVRRQQRPRYGFYVDHVIDLAGATALFGGLAASGLMHSTFALLLLVGFLLVSAEVYLATCSSGVFRLSFLGVGPTELRILLAAGALRAMTSPWVTLPPFGRYLFFDLAGAAGAAGLMLAFGLSALRQTRTLSREEPRPAPAG